jgi:hypothetical protein
MTYQYARIDLSKTNYQSKVDWCCIREPDIAQLNEIYRTYCTYKRFGSVMPIFDSQYTDADTDIIGYYSNEKKLVAFSLIKRYDTKNALCAQFAWTYHDPKTRLGINSLKTECAIYKQRGFDYLYLDQAHLYKQGFDGFELLGPLQ